MKLAKQYLRKKILVLGLAKSGVAAARLLHQLGAFVTVNDYTPSKEADALLEEGITVICGHHPVDLLDEGFELVVKNPGINYENVMIARAEELGIPIITEIELAYQICESPIIAISGTNGKTTTTTLIYEMLLKGNKNPVIAGNIGTVACEVAQTATKDQIMVLELSSFQLMGIQAFRPHVAVLTNLSSTHLDYHGTLEAYYAAKFNILRNQTSDDYFVYNGTQPEFHEAATRTKAKLQSFAFNPDQANSTYIKEDWIYHCDQPVIAVKDIILPGIHSLENILAAITAVKNFDVSNDAIIEVLTTFTGVRHRYQYVKELNERKFYNDSKATNIVAATKALDSVVTPTILLAGGMDRGNGFDELIPALKNVKILIAFGATAEKLVAVAKKAGVQATKIVENVEEAVPLAYQLSAAGDTILLSPACASWGQYKSFEVRGDIFIEAVHKLK